MLHSEHACAKKTVFQHGGKSIYACFNVNVSLNNIGSIIKAWGTFKRRLFTCKRVLS
jgi:hypothetical protein